MSSTPNEGAAAASAWIARLLHSSDSAYPTGGYAHSFGLEGLVQQDIVRNRETLRRFVSEHALPPLAFTDLPIAARSFDAARAVPADWDRLRELCLLASAVRGTREPREASEATGRQRAELAALLHGGIAAEFNARAAAGNWPRPACVAAAIEGVAIGAPRDAVLCGIVYNTAAGMLSAAVKLLRLGQNAIHTLLAEVLAQTPALIEQALAVHDNAIGAFNPWWDIASARHEHADFRLFIS